MLQDLVGEEERQSSVVLGAEMCPQPSSSLQ